MEETTGGRVLSILVEVDNFKCNLVNVYAPTNLTEGKTFFEHLHEFLWPSDSIVVGGDFNCYEKERDKFGGNATIAQYLSDFRISVNLTDVWRLLHPRSHEMTRFNFNFSVGSRLDKFLVSSNLLQNVTSCDILPCCLSDHDCVALHVHFPSSFPQGARTVEI